METNPPNQYQGSSIAQPMTERQLHIMVKFLLTDICVFLFLKTVMMYYRAMKVSWIFYESKMQRKME